MQQNYHTMRYNIFFMSGTGNSLTVANNIANNLNSKHIPTGIYNIENRTNIKDINRGSVGIVFPTHGFTAPWLVIKFVATLKFGNWRPAFTLCTRAGARIGKVYTPGLGGSANLIVALLLLIRGYRPKIWGAVDMPSNWMAIHPALSNKTCREIYQRAKKRTDILAEKIANNSTHIFTPNNIYDLIPGIILLQISFMYIIFFRFFLAKLFFASHKCTSCGLCAEYCMTNAIKMIGKKRPKPYWKLRCESCMRCIGYCPHKAIEVGHSWAVILFMVAGASGLPAIVINNTVPEHLLNEWWIVWLTILLAFPSMVIAYYIFHLINRVHFINKLFSFTTFTRLFKKYKHTGVNINRFKS